MMLVITFGLSMDYEMFLLSSMKEEWVKTRDAILIDATVIRMILAHRRATSRRADTHQRGW
jgi:uncharacterized membrane protein YdfJ with MMPL/SSD domain